MSNRRPGEEEQARQGVLERCHVVVPGVSAEWAPLVDALTGALRDHFRQVAVWPAGESEAVQVEWIRSLPAGEPVLVVPARGAGEALARELAGRIAVLAERYLPATRFDAFVVENYRAGYLAGKHLVNLKHRRIAYLGPEPGTTSHDERLRGFRQALLHNGRELPEERVRQVPATLGAGQQACEELLAAAEPPTALFAASESLAAAVLDVLEKRGLRVPGDVAVVGYGDGLLARALRPRLTTVAPPLAQLARGAAQRLAELARAGTPAGERRAEPERLPPRLIIRASCGMGA
ncbi:MAG TPA: substrate-binding domain-containing protein [Thermaerobacter sp.]